MPTEERTGEADISQGSYDVIGRILKARAGFLLESYKDKCVKRRINIRIRATRSPSAEAYCDLLTESGAEQELLLKVITIHVSQFFRNPSTFAKLEQLIPELLACRPGSEPLSFWSVGCAGGEEPYTLSLILKERFPELLAGRGVSIVATDVNRSVLETASSGRYGADRLIEVDQALLTRWFTREGNVFRLSPAIRSMVSFRQGDLSHDTCFLKSDLIMCRNVLIYFERPRQEAILSRFADSLEKGGILVLGRSETLVGEARKRFAAICPEERIYRRL